ncbi:Gfo/Idh/MocA family oxidoreductase [Pelagibacterales bacterium SAG-MED41]|nr:Gfo/Idh/MocA family oxidoreductase [Pelagibacterales bacterium SAG-MED41]
MIKSCVIGLSKIGQIHCSNLKKIKKTSLNYVYDKDFTLRNKTAKKFKCKTSNSFEEILRNKDVKLFIIASPTTTHEYYLDKLIKHKKMIYCEKPISLNASKLDVLVKRIRSNRIKICIGLNRRFSDAYIKMKKLINSKQVKIIQIISRSSNANVKQSVRNGGLFMDKGFHFFDLACWFANSFPNKIITIANPLSTKEFLKNNDYSDAVVNMKFKNKIIVEYIFSRNSRLGHEERIKLFGNGFKIDSDKYFKKSIIYKNFDIKHKESYFRCLKKFIRLNKNLLLNEGIRTQKICDNVLKSARLN